MLPKDRLVTEATFHVRFAETDAMGVVHHAAYIVYFEEGRSHLSRVIGAPYSALEDSGYSLAVSEVTARYITPARYDQLVSVLTWVEELRSRGVTFGYEIVNAETRETLVTGQTRHTCTDHLGQVRRLPEDWVNAMRKAVEAPL
jgi:acyl-CoA thioester hydrolase